jgi:hypothetical protein
MFLSLTSNTDRKIISHKKRDISYLSVKWLHSRSVSVLVVAAGIRHPNWNTDNFTVKLRSPVHDLADDAATAALQMCSFSAKWCAIMAYRTRQEPRWQMAHLPAIVSHSLAGKYCCNSVQNLLYSHVQYKTLRITVTTLWFYLVSYMGVKLCVLFRGKNTDWERSRIFRP